MGFLKIKWSGSSKTENEFTKCSQKHYHEYKWSVRWMILLSILEASFLYIQAGKVFKTKSVEDLSIPSYIILVITSLFWLHYAIVVTKDRAMLVSSILYTIGSTLMLIGIYIYK